MDGVHAASELFANGGSARVTNESARQADDAETRARGGQGSLAM